MAALKVTVLAAVALAVGSVPQLVFENTHRIFGGEDASENEFPGQVYVLTSARDEASKQVVKVFCGGTIISQTWVVTAAHCVEGSFHTLVWGGASNLNDMQSIRAKRVIQHEGYQLYGRNDNNARNDLALVELSKPFKIDGRTLVALPLPKYREKLEALPGFAVVGWGRWTYDPNMKYVDEWATESLKKLSIRVIQCPGNYNDSNVICAQSAAGSGICDGDSGGPLLKKGVVYGVASFVDNINPDLALDPNEHCNEEGSWAVFMALSSYRPWIYSHTGI